MRMATSLTDGGSLKSCVGPLERGDGGRWPGRTTRWAGTGRLCGFLRRTGRRGNRELFKNLIELFLQRAVLGF